MSKSGSKALSKSVDSVVKSVESVVSSVLPKNMNMKHVLLAILVGLLLCMLMGNTVEGFNMYTISGESGSETIDTGTNKATGFCRTGSSTIMQRSCVPSDASIDGVGSGDGSEAKKTAMNNVCSSPEVSSVGGCLGTSEAPGERSGPFIVQKMTEETSLDPSVDNLECTLGGEVDQCATAAFNNSETCTSSAGKDLGCVWEGCEFTGDNTVMMGADNSNPDKASIVLDLKDPFLPEYDRWRKCLFGNKNSLLEGDPAPLNVPTDLTTGNFPSYATEGAAWTTPPEPSPGDSVTGLDGWVTGHAGYPRTVPAMKSVQLTADELASINAIPMTEEGKVTPALAPHLPPAWKTGFENMYEYCKSGNPNGYAAIGWSPDFRSLQCLNYNPTHKKINITTQRTRHPCGPCLGECLAADKDYRYDPPNNAESIVNCNESFTDRATAMAKIATLGNLASVKEGGTEIATNLLKFIVS